MTSPSSTRMNDSWPNNVVSYSRMTTKRTRRSLQSSRSHYKGWETITIMVSKILSSRMSSIRWRQIRRTIKHRSNSRRTLWNRRMRGLERTMLCKTWWERVSMTEMGWRDKEELLLKRAGFHIPQTTCSAGLSPNTGSRPTSSRSSTTCSSRRTSAPMRAPTLPSRTNSAWSLYTGRWRGRAWPALIKRLCWRIFKAKIYWLSNRAWRGRAPRWVRWWAAWSVCPRIVWNGSITFLNNMPLKDTTYKFL